MTEARAPYRLIDAPRIVSVDLPEDDDELLRFCWRLTNVAWDLVENGGLVEPGDCLNPDGLHTLILNALIQMRDDGIEAIMNDLEHQTAYGEPWL